MLVAREINTSRRRLGAYSPRHPCHSDHRTAFLAFVAAPAVANLTDQHAFAQHRLDGAGEELAVVATGAGGGDGVVARVAVQEVTVGGGVGLGVRSMGKAQRGAAPAQQAVMFGAGCHAVFACIDYCMCSA